MPRSPPPWFDQAASMLAGGSTKVDVARALGIRRETVSRQFSRLKPEVERRIAAATAAEPADLFEKAQQVMAGGLDSEDKRVAFEAAKIVIAKLAPQLPHEPEPAEEEVAPEAAIRELVASLPTLRAVLAEGGVPPELVEELRRALDAARADLEPALAAVNGA